MKSLPVRRTQFKTAAFASWLVAQGAELRQPTNPYEVVRYLAYADGSRKALTHIVYAKESGLLTFTGSSREHYIQFAMGARMYPEARDIPLQGNPPNGWQRPTGEPFSKKGKSEGGVKREKLLARDGDECWFCGLAMGDDVTIEHLVAKSNGGKNGLDNYALAHGECNRRAANLPLVKKIDLRAQMRAEKTNA